MSDESTPPPPRGSLRKDGGRTRRRIGEILLDRGLILPEQLASALAEQAGLDLVDPTAVAIDVELVQRFDLELARRHVVLPLYVSDSGTVAVAIADPAQRAGLVAAGRFLDAPVEAVLAEEARLRDAIEQAFRRAEEAEAVARREIPGTLDIPPAAPPIGPLAAALPATVTGDAWGSLLGGLVAHMLQLEADRLRFAAWQDGASGQLRVAGRWAEVLRLEGAPANALLDAIADRFVAREDGLQVLNLSGAAEGRTLLSSMSLRSGGRQLDLRIYEPQAEIAQSDLGLDEDVTRRLRQWTASREGVLLVVGPHASGRSTTLRALAASLGGYRGAVYVGEPPAPDVDGVDWLDGSGGGQAVHEALRRRPRVLVVDDVSEADAARAALGAAHDDCLVVAGLLGQDAHDALQTLRDRGVSDALLGDRLLGIVEQRLLRGLCPHCYRKGAPDPELLRRLGLRPDDVMREVPTQGAGCAQCHGLGTHGWVLLATRVELGGGIAQGTSAADLRGYVDRSRPTGALDAGRTLLRQGRVGLDELARVLAPPTPQPVVSAEAGGWMPGMPEETVEAASPVVSLSPDGVTLDQFLDLDPDPEGDDRHLLLLFDPRDNSYQGLAAIIPSDRCRVVAASDWDEAMEIVRKERPTAVLLPAASDPVATRGRIRAFRDDLASAFLPLCVLVPPGTSGQNLLETGADEVLAITDPVTVRSGLLALLDRVT